MESDEGKEDPSPAIVTSVAQCGEQINKQEATAQTENATVGESRA